MATPDILGNVAYMATVSQPACNGIVLQQQPDAPAVSAYRPARPDGVVVGTSTGTRDVSGMNYMKAFFGVPPTAPAMELRTAADVAASATTSSAATGLTSEHQTRHLRPSPYPGPPRAPSPFPMGSVTSPTKAQRQQQQQLPWQAPAVTNTAAAPAAICTASSRTGPTNWPTPLPGPNPFGDVAAGGALGTTSSYCCSEYGCACDAVHASLPPYNEVYDTSYSGTSYTAPLSSGALTPSAALGRAATAMPATAPAMTPTTVMGPVGGNCQPPPTTYTFDPQDAYFQPPLHQRSPMKPEAWNVAPQSSNPSTAATHVTTTPPGRPSPFRPSAPPSGGDGPCSGAAKPPAGPPEGAPCPLARGLSLHHLPYPPAAFHPPHHHLHPHAHSHPYPHPHHHPHRHSPLKRPAWSGLYGGAPPPSGYLPYGWPPPTLPLPYQHVPAPRVASWHHSSGAPSAIAPLATGLPPPLQQSLPSGGESEAVRTDAGYMYGYSRSYSYGHSRSLGGALDGGSSVVHAGLPLGMHAGGGFAPRRQSYPLQMVEASSQAPRDGGAAPSGPTADVPAGQVADSNSNFTASVAPGDHSGSASRQPPSQAGASLHWSPYGGHCLAAPPPYGSAQGPFARAAATTASCPARVLRSASLNSLPLVPPLPFPDAPYVTHPSRPYISSLYGVDEESALEPVASAPAPLTLDRTDSFKRRRVATVTAASDGISGSQPSFLAPPPILAPSPFPPLQTCRSLPPDLHRVPPHPAMMHQSPLQLFECRPDPLKTAAAVESAGAVASVQASSYTSNLPGRTGPTEELGSAVPLSVASPSFAVPAGMTSAMMPSAFLALEDMWLDSPTPASAAAAAARNGSGVGSGGGAGLSAADAAEFTPSVAEDGGAVGLAAAADLYDSFEAFAMRLGLDELDVVLDSPGDMLTDADMRDVRPPTPGAHTSAAPVVAPPAHALPRPTLPAVLDGTMAMAAAGPDNLWTTAEAVSPLAVAMKLATASEQGLASDIPQSAALSLEPLPAPAAAATADGPAAAAAGAGASAANDAASGGFLSWQQASEPHPHLPPLLLPQDVKLQHYAPPQQRLQQQSSPQQSSPQQSSPQQSSPQQSSPQQSGDVNGTRSAENASPADNPSPTSAAARSGQLEDLSIAAVASATVTAAGVDALPQPVSPAGRRRGPGSTPRPPSSSRHRTAVHRRLHGNINRTVNLSCPFLQDGALRDSLPGPVKVTVAATSAAATSSTRHGSDDDGDDGDSSNDEGQADEAEDGPSGGRGGRGTGGGGGGVVGSFHVWAYLEGRKCIECRGEMVSRSAFERMGGSMMAKWYRSIKVLPEGVSLSKWLADNGLPILRGNPRRSKKGTQRQSHHTSPQSDGEVS